MNYLSFKTINLFKWLVFKYKPQQLETSFGRENFTRFVINYLLNFFSLIW